jgi:hypothetical protein
LLLLVPAVIIGEEDEEVDASVDDDPVLSLLMLLLLVDNSRITDKDPFVIIPFPICCCCTSDPPSSLQLLRSDSRLLSALVWEAMETNPSLSEPRSFLLFSILPFIMVDPL